MDNNMEIPEGFKMTEFGTLPEEWNIKKINEFVTIKSGGTPSRKKPEYWGGVIPWVKTTEVNYKTITVASENITQKGLDSSSARIVPKGTLLMAMYGQGVTRGRVAVLGIDAAINQACAAFLEVKNTNIVFLYHYFTYKYDELRNLGHGAHQKNLNANIIKTICVSIPPLPEQKIIAAVLSAVQEAREETEAVILAAKELKKSLMKHLFTYGPVSLEEAEKVPLKETEIGFIPKHWNVVEFKELLNNGTQNGIYKPRKLYGKGASIVDMNDIFYSEILVPERLERLELFDDETKKYLLCEGDLLFARRSFKASGSGKCQLVKRVTVPTVFSSSIIKVSPKKDKVYSKFYLYFFSSSMGRRIMKRIIRHQTVSGISGGDLKLLPVIKVPLEEQQEISGILSAVDQKIEAEENKKKALDELFKTLLDNLMTAKIRVNHLEMDT